LSWSDTGTITLPNCEMLDIFLLLSDVVVA
jgi:hypothetical protein